MSPLSRVVRIFISSTFRDFAGERNILVRKIFPELRRRCRERQVELGSILALRMLSAVASSIRFWALSARGGMPPCFDSSLRAPSPNKVYFNLWPLAY